MTRAAGNLRERPFKIVTQRTLGMRDNPESDRAGTRFPAADQLWRTAEMIPGIGNAVNAVAKRSLVAAASQC